MKHGPAPWGGCGEHIRGLPVPQLLCSFVVARPLPGRGRSCQFAKCHCQWKLNIRSRALVPGLLGTPRKGDSGNALSLVRETGTYCGLRNDKATIWGLLLNSKHGVERSQNWGLLAANSCLFIHFNWWDFLTNSLKFTAQGKKKTRIRTNCKPGSWILHCDLCDLHDLHAMQARGLDLEASSASLVPGRFLPGRWGSRPRTTDKPPAPTLGRQSQFSVLTLLQTRPVYRPRSGVPERSADL